MCLIITFKPHCVPITSIFPSHFADTKAILLYKFNNYSLCRVFFFFERLMLMHNRTQHKVEKDIIITIICVCLLIIKKDN